MYANALFRKSEELINPDFDEIKTIGKLSPGGSTANESRTSFQPRSLSRQANSAYKLPMNVPANISRRRILKAVAILPMCAAVNTAPLAAQPRPVTFVLVHGAWHGGWCWKKVTPLLRAAGYPVFTPTLTGLGERSHLISPAVDLTVHTQDIVAVLDYEDLHDVVLVGHSYGGMVITGVAEKAAEHLPN